MSVADECHERWTACQIKVLGVAVAAVGSGILVASASLLAGMVLAAGAGFRAIGSFVDCYLDRKKCLRETDG